MPQPMTPAPETNLDALVDALRQARNAAGNGAGFLAGLVSPPPHTPAAALVAAMRSLAPWRGTYEHELARYNQAAGPYDSVIDTAPLPGEDYWAFLDRESKSPQRQRDMMMAATLAAPLAVHASPTWWTGKPHEDFIGTGEGGAAYGRGALYASVPENAQGLDRRYGGNPARPERAHVYAKNPDGTIASKFEFATLKEAKRAIPKIKKQLGDGYSYVATSIAPAEATGSFHVFDVPDELMDYDAPLGQQAPGVQSALFEGDLMPVGRQSFGWRSAPEEYFENARNTPSRTGRWLLQELGSGADTELASRGIPGHTYKGEAGSAATSGIEGAVPNFVIYKGDSVRPLGTFRSAEEWLASELYKQLKPRLDAEQALRASGKATPEGYAEIRRRFPIPESQGEYIEGVTPKPTLREQPGLSVTMHGPAGFSRITTGGLLSDEALGSPSPTSAFRGVTQEEMSAIAATGKVRSNQSWSVPGEGTNFADNLADAASYASSGRTNPTTTGQPTYVIEVPQAGMTRGKDGYLKVGEVDAAKIQRVWRFNPDGSVEVGTYGPAGATSATKGR